MVYVKGGAKVVKVPANSAGSLGPSSRCMRQREMGRGGGVEEEGQGEGGRERVPVVVSRTGISHGSTAGSPFWVPHVIGIPESGVKAPRTWLVVPEHAGHNGSESFPGQQKEENQWGSYDTKSELEVFLLLGS